MILLLNKDAKEVLQRRRELSVKMKKIGIQKVTLQMLIVYIYARERPNESPAKINKVISNLFPGFSYHTCRRIHEQLIKSKLI